MNRWRLIASATVVCLWSIGPASFAQEAGDELVQLVVSLFSESDNDLRALGFDQVRSDAPGEAATRRFAAELPKLPSDAQVGLLAALGDRGDAAAKPAVLELLADDGEKLLRLAAIRALGQLGNADDVPRLTQLLAQTAAREKETVRESLVRLSGNGVAEAIVAEMQSADAKQRIALIEVLTSRRAVETISVILSAARDPDPAIRKTAMSALGEIAGPEQLVDMLTAILRAEPGKERASAEKAVMFVCNRVSDPQQRAESLLDAWGEFDRADRLTLLGTVGRVGGAAALEKVEAAVRDSDPAVHEAGVRAICSWPDASIAERLIEIANEDEHSKHRQLALRALIRVAPLPDGRPDDARLELLQQVMQMCQDDKQRRRVLQRAPAIRTVATLRFVAPYMSHSELGQQACVSVVELAHHRNLRQPNKDEFHKALDQVLQTSRDATVLDRAQRYKKEQTWVRPK